ncbi:porin [Limnohabitans sp. Rim28]|nr:porin [Limnohabitans sp. Rim28]PVE07638.1 porin [Limnohabitans sp. Rim28]
MAAAGTAFAQSTATISGSISVGVMDTGAAGATAAVSTLGGGANAINIVTVEDLGGGLRGGFDSQMRFNAATGDRNSSGTGAALLHGANVYLSGGFGTVRMGKIIEANNCAFDPWACTGGAGFAAGAPGTISTLIAAQTIANSVSYATPTVNGFSGSYHTSVSARTNERSVMSLNYGKGPLSAQYLQSKNSVNIAGDVAGAASITDVAGQGTSVGASYNFGVARLSAVNAKTENAAGATTADITAVTASMPMGAYTLLAGYAKDKKRAATADTKLAIGANYALSKRTTLGADLFKQEQVGGSTGFVVRARHNF